MFERYTERARRVLFFGRYEASQLGSLAIDTEHLLLGLLREGKGLTSRLFARAHLSLEGLRTEIEKQVSFREKTPTSKEIPFTQAAKRALEAAATEADRLLHNYIGTEHLLLGLLTDETTMAGRFLGSHGLRLHVVRDEIVQLLNEKEPGFEEERPHQTPMPLRIRRPLDDRLKARLVLSQLLNVSMCRIDAPDHIDVPLTITRERRAVDAYVMTRVASRSPQPSAQRSGGIGNGFGSVGMTVAASVSQLRPDERPAERVHSFGPLSLSGTTMSDLGTTLEHVLETPVIDETGLEGRYDIELVGLHDSVETFLAALSEHAGLRLTRAKREIELFVVRCL